MPLETLTRLRYASNFCQDPPSYSLILVGLRHGKAHLQRIFDRQPALDNPLVGCRLRDLAPIAVELIGDFADDLLDDILDGHHAGGATVLVHNDRRLIAVSLHL